MSITDNIKSTIEKYKQRRELKNYDHLPANAKSPSIGRLKLQRLRIKNMRRVQNGLPPKATYAEI